MSRPSQRRRPPHGKLSEIDENILTVTGDIRMPMMSLPRRMTVVRLNGGPLIVFSAIALNEDEMAKPKRIAVRHSWSCQATSIGSMRSRGRTAIRPCRSSRRKAPAPRWRTWCRSTRSRLASTTRTSSSSPFPEREGTRRLIVRTPNGTTLVLNDLVGNIRSEPGSCMRRLAAQLAGFAGKEAQIPRVVKMVMIKDSNALRSADAMGRDRVAEAHPRIARLADRGEPASDLARSGELAGVRKNGRQRLQCCVKQPRAQPARNVVASGEAPLHRRLDRNSRASKVVATSI